MFYAFLKKQQAAVGVASGCFVATLALRNGRIRRLFREAAPGSSRGFAFLLLLRTFCLSPLLQDLSEGAGELCGGP